MSARNGDGPYVLRSKRDRRYIGREPDGDTPAIQCWPRRLTRHVRRFATREEAQRYLDDGGTGFVPSSQFYEPHAVLRVRPIATGTGREAVKR